MTNANENRLLFNKTLGEEEKAYIEFSKFKVQRVLELVEEKPGGRFLDVGCGSGFIAKEVKHKTKHEVYGIDIAEKALKIARRRGIIVKKVDIDGKSLPFKNNYFDGIYCGDVIEHVISTEHLVRELHRITKPGGYIITSVPNVASWYNRILLLLGELPLFIDSTEKNPVGKLLGVPREPVGHVRGFTKQGIVNLLEYNGFTVIESRCAAGAKEQKIKKSMQGLLENIRYELLYEIEKQVSQNIGSLASFIILKAHKK